MPQGCRVTERDCEPSARPEIGRPMSLFQKFNELTQPNETGEAVDWLPLLPLIEQDPAQAREKNEDGNSILCVVIKAQPPVPVEIVNAILKAYPEAARDLVDGRFPIVAIAAEANAPLEVRRALLAAWPEAATMIIMGDEVPDEEEGSSEGSSLLALLAGVAGITGMTQGVGAVAVKDLATSLEFILDVFRLNPAAAATKCQGMSPLSSILDHAACFREVEWDAEARALLASVVIKLVKACPAAAAQRCEQVGGASTVCFPLAVANWTGSIEIVRAVYEAYPAAAAGWLNGDQPLCPMLLTDAAVANLDIFMFYLDQDPQALHRLVEFSHRGDSTTATCLHQAVKIGCKDVVKVVMERCPDSCFVADSNAEFPLQVALARDPPDNDVIEALRNAFPEAETGVALALLSRLLDFHNAMGGDSEFRREIFDVDPGEGRPFALTTACPPLPNFPPPFLLPSPSRQRLAA